jgi:hypothetical protein
VRKDLGGDELVADATLVDANDSGQYTDRLLLAKFCTCSFERHADQGVGRPELLAAEIEAAGADVDDLVGLGRSAGEVEGDKAGKCNALSTATVAAERNGLPCEPALYAGGEGEFLFRRRGKGSRNFPAGLRGDRRMLPRECRRRLVNGLRGPWRYETSRLKRGRAF